MKKTYTDPEVVVERLMVEDIITTSPGGITGGEGDGNTGGGGGIFD